MSDHEEEKESPDVIVRTLEELSNTESKLWCAHSVFEQKYVTETDLAVVGAITLLNECAASLKSIRNILDEAAVNGVIVCTGTN